MGTRASKQLSAKRSSAALEATAITAVDMAITNFDYKWVNLVVSGGGIKAIAAVGTLRVLEIVGALARIRRFAGSSAGSIVCLCLVLGYTVDQILEIMMHTDFGRFASNNIVVGTGKMITELGMNSGDDLLEFVHTLLRNRVFPEDITFHDLYTQTTKYLIVTACNVNTGETEYFSHLDKPQMQVADAIRMSCSIPFVFTPVQHGLDHDLYVDGGLFANYPLDVFDVMSPRDDTLGIKFIPQALVPDAKGKSPRSHGRQEIGSAIDYGLCIINRMLEEIERLQITPDYWARTVPVYTGKISGTDFNVDTKTKRLLYDSGIKSTVEFLREHIQRTRRARSWFRRRGSSETRKEAAAQLRSAILKANRAERAVSGVFRSVGEIMIPSSPSKSLCK